MDALLGEVLKLTTNQRLIDKIKHDFSILANHFVCYHQYLGSDDLSIDFVERINYSFPYLDYSIPIDGLSRVIELNGYQALWEMVCRIDPALNFRDSNIQFYIINYISAGFPMMLDSGIDMTV